MKHWYVMRSKPQKEDFLFEQLRLRKIEAYYPSLRVQPVNPRSRRIKPYFPGYLFISADFEQIGISILQWLPGSLGLVNCGGDPAYVSDDLVQTIRHRVDHINSTGCEARDSLKQGDNIAILSGPFAGYQAIFDSRLQGNERVRVLLKMLQDRQIYVELSGGQIKKLQ